MKIIIKMLLPGRTINNDVNFVYIWFLKTGPAVYNPLMLRVNKF